MTKKHLFTLIQIFAGLTIVATLARYISVDYWWARIFDFPHLQLTGLCAVAIALYFVKFDYRWYKDYIMIGILLVCFILQIRKVYNYTPLSSYEIEESTVNNTSKQFKLYTVNVLQKNKETKLLINEIKAEDPDILVLLEINSAWMKNIRDIVTKKYKYKVEVPQDNTYGMLVYSKLELIDPKVKYLVDSEIPSVHSKMRFRNGELFQLHVIHPTPPMPQHNDMSTDRDKEMMIMANEIMNAKLPVIVTGDFNDVAWSRTTSLFQNVSGLLDVRVGRGFYNTFNADNILMRWPLDHVFASEHFRVVKVGLGEDINSDHFPFKVILSYEPESASEQKKRKPTKDELERMKKQMDGDATMPIISDIN